MSLNTALLRSRVQRQQKRIDDKRRSQDSGAILLQAGGYAGGQRQATTSTGGAIALQGVAGGSQPSGAIGVGIKVGDGYVAIW